jgi:hypothetical protein
MRAGDTLLLVNAAKMNNSHALKVITVLAFGLFLFFLGYFRNFVFMAINAETSAIYYHAQGPDLPGFLQFLSSKDYDYLIKLKWILTILFTLVFFATSLFIMKIFFKEPVYLKICVILYSFLSVASFFMMGIGYFFRSFSYHAFNIARNIMHISQSPFTVLLLCVIAYYYKRTSKS